MVTTYSAAIDPMNFSTDAKFRSWGSAVNASLAAAGFVQTSDTGQINWTTAARPTTVSTQAGYEVWRFADSLQATAPIYFRIGYGSGGQTSGQNASTWLTVGTGTDGAGTVTGLVVATTQGNSSTTTHNNASTPIMACHTAGYGLIVPGLNITATANAGLWCIARTCDTSGAPTAEGFVVYRTTNWNTSIRCVSIATATVFAGRNVGSAPLNVSATLSSGTRIVRYRNFAILGGPVPLMGAVSYYGPDITSYTTFTAAPWGSTPRTYYALGAAADQHSSYAGSQTSIYGAYLWE